MRIEGKDTAGDHVPDAAAMSAGARAGPGPNPSFGWRVSAMKMRFIVAP
jgi:hypothetical protein